MFRLKLTGEQGKTGWKHIETLAINPHGQGDKTYMGEDKVG